MIKIFIKTTIIVLLFLMTASLTVYAESASIAVTVTVEELPANNPPALDPIGDKTVEEGRMLSFRITASDPDFDRLTFTVINQPEGSRFRQIRSRQRRQGRAHFLWRPTFEQAGTYEVTFVVTDDEEPPLNNSETITITVNEAAKER